MKKKKLFKVKSKKEKKQKKEKKFKGITLISLVMTLTIMVILASVTVNVILGSGGFISKTTKSAQSYKASEYQEQLQVSATNGYVLKHKKGMEDLNIADQMSKEHPEIEWVSKDSLAGRYNGFDFTVIDKVVVMNVLDINTLQNLNSDNYDASRGQKFWKYRASIINISFIIDSNLDKYQTNAVVNTDDPNKAKVPWDVSESQNKKILAYMEEVTPGDTSKYNLFIVSDKIICLPENSSYLFSRFQYIESINNIENVGTSSVKNMNGLFTYSGYNMKSFDLGNNFDTSNVIYMDNMFANFGFTALENFSLGTKFNTANVTNMSGMFSSLGFKKLRKLDLGAPGINFDTSNVSTMRYMFMNVGSYELRELYLGSKFNTSKVRDMYAMFESTGQYYLTNLNLGDNFNTSSCTNMDCMFFGVGEKNLKTLDLGPNFDTSNVTTMANMFRKCPALEVLKLGDKFNTSKVINMKLMFYNCGTNRMKSLDLGPNFDTSNVSDMNGIFENCGQLYMTALNLGDKFKIANDCNITDSFKYVGSSLCVITWKSLQTDEDKANYITLTSDLFSPARTVSEPV